MARDNIAAVTAETPQPKADPDRATSKSHGRPNELVPPGTGAVEYTCPMHPEVRQTGPGACPKCGMALEPVVPHAPPARSVEYTCPDASRNRA